MKRFTLAYFAAVFACVAGSWADDSGKIIAERVQQLTAATQWKAVREIPLQFDAFHPQGMAMMNGEIYVSSVEVISRANGEGKGHLFKIGADGSLLKESVVSSGKCYHPGGIDFDGTWIWFPVAEYRPDSNSVVYRCNPATMTMQPMFSFSDHIGLMIHDPKSGLIFGASWGSRKFFQWNENALPSSDAQAIPTVNATNRSHYVDLQDGQWLPGTTQMLCGGLKDYRGPKGNFALGGLELIDMPSLTPVHQVPVSLWEPGGRSMLQNAFQAEATETGLRFLFLPGDGKATIYVYEPELAPK